MILKLTWFYYLVESKGQLLVIRRVTLIDCKGRRCCTTRFDVLELNVKTGDVKQVKSLRNRSIFIGLNSSFSVEVDRSLSHGGFKANCIYYTDDQVESKYTRSAFGCGFKDYVYSLSDEKFDSFYQGPSQLIIGEWRTSTTYMGRISYFYMIILSFTCTY